MARVGDWQGHAPAIQTRVRASSVGACISVRLNATTVVAARLVHWRTFRGEPFIYAHTNFIVGFEPPDGGRPRRKCASSLARVSDLPVRGAKAMPDQKRSQQTEMDEAAAEGGDCVIQLRDLGDGNVHLRIVQALPASLAKQIGSLLASTPEGKRVLH
jgi:hypothetical protein